MPRKFQLGVHRKNAFRKKRAFRLQDPDHPALSFDVLQKKVKELAVLPKGWINTSDHAQVVDRLVISKIELHGESATITRSLTILEDFSWSISAFGQKVPCFAEFPDKITTVTGVCAVISHLDACITCVGNSDEKFKCLIEERKGNFMDSSGCKQIAYCDGFTVASTIRTTSCLVLTLPKNLETESRCSSCHSHRKVLNSMLSRHNKQHSEKLKRKGPEVDSSVLPKCKITHNILGPN